MDIVTKDCNPIEEYKNVMLRSLKLTFPSLEDDEITKAIEYSVKKRFKDSECHLYNNYKDMELNSTLSKMVQYISSKKPILTAYGVLFSKHGDVVNPYYDFVESLANLRTKYKNKMFEYTKGTEMYNKYNLLQLLAKIDMNGLYGTMGSPSSIFFNLHVAPSITAMGQSIISATISFFESIMANNIHFGSMDEVVTFIDNIVTEKGNRKFNDRDILDRDITITECFYKVIGTTGYMWVPTEKEANMIWDMLTRVSQENLNRIYYKNNMFNFCDNSKIKTLLLRILCSLKTPFLNPNKLPETIKDDMHLLLAYIKEYVYYEYITLDKLDRVEVMPRDVVLIVDTDSCIISLEAWYQFVSKFTVNIDMPIKHQKYDIIKLIERDEFGDLPKMKVMELIDYEYEYDFYKDDLVETNRLIEPMKLIPQDGLRSSIVDIMSYILSQLVLDYMSNFCDHYYSSSPGRKCLLISKNEFLFKSILLTWAKKHYASNVLNQEGRAVPKKEALNITGLTFDQSQTPDSTSEELKRILFEEILDPEDGVDQLKVLKSISTLEKRIYNSLSEGDTTYHKPVRIRPMSVYAKPMHIQGVKASYVYNQLKPDSSTSIDLNERNSLLIIKVVIDKKTIETVKDSNPDLYNKAKKLLETKEFKMGISSIAIPFDTDIPKWIISFINYDEIINDNIKGFPVDSIGIDTFNNDNISYTNILTL